ncbi:MAG: class I SAM-dependent methyltransferase [Bacteroidota bacterium]|nr:class I SAM-dependent methyltransferase [Bacteroidota bacterium]
MSEQSNKSIANSLETNERLLPYMPFLLQDLWVMGSSGEQIIILIGELKLHSDKTKVLDLGCGKGAVSIQIAAKYGFKVVGIDAMKQFLEEANKKAHQYNVSHLCEFIEQDIFDYVSVEHDYDIVILAAVGGVFGSLQNTVAQLRTQVRSGGYMIIDDGYLRDGKSISRKGYGHYRNHEETIRELTFYDDKLLGEINTNELSSQINYEYHHLIEKRGKELIALYPELENEVKSYIDLQAEECDVLKNQIEGALWLLKTK